MKLGRILLAALASLGLSMAVEAKTTNLGSLGDAATPFFGNNLAPGDGITTFTDTVTFSLATVSNIFGGFFGSGISGFTVTLDSNQGNIGVTPGPYTFGTYSFSDLSPGSHTFTITGAPGSLGGAYLSAFQVAAVPETETWLMVIVGIGLVGYQLRRKQKTLVRHPLQQAV